MAWCEEWTIDSVAGNYKAIGMIDREDVEQLIADSRKLSKAIEWLQYIHSIQGNLSSTGLDELELFIKGDV